LVGVSLASSAQAATIYSLSLTRDDGVTTPATWTMNQPDPGTGGPTYSNTYDVHNANWDFQWGVTGDPDPVVSSNLTITNNTAVTQTYISTVTLPIAPAITPSSLIGGSISGSVTDVNGNGATLATAAPDALYTALIDGVSVHTLYDNPSSFVVTPPFGSASVPSADFGSPIPSLPGPAANSSIAIQLKFTLTPGDSMALTSVFVVNPVPEPVGLGVFGLAAAGHLGRRRRQLA
jgi:hypothetical protein